MSLALRGEAPSFRPALFAFLCLVATQLVFWLFTYPMNVRTRNWTSVPKDFEAARRQWEYSHATSAGLNLLAFVGVILARDVSLRLPLRGPELSSEAHVPTSDEIGGYDEDT